MNTAARALVASVQVRRDAAAAASKARPLVPTKDGSSLLEAMTSIQETRRAVDQCAARDAVAGLCDPQRPPMRETA